MVTLLFLAVLALAWAAVFLPASLRARQNEPLSTAEKFRRRMQLIAPRRSSGKGRWVVVPESRDRLARASFRRTQRRRKQILVALIASAALTFVAAVAAGGAFWELHLLLDLSLGVFVALLREAKHRREESASKVFSIGPDGAAGEEAQGSGVLDSAAEL